MIYNKINRKGFTLMELLVTVIVVSILASYAVYYYTNVMRESEVHAAEGKLAALGGAVARFKIEYGNTTLSSPVEITRVNIGGACDYYNADPVIKIMSIFSCGYVEKSLGFDDNFNFYFGAADHSSCGGSVSATTVFMRPKPETSNGLYPSCAYFNPDTDKVEEVHQ